MSTGMLSIGVTGLNAAQMGLQVTQHNIANANTDGYNRQYLLQSAGVPRTTGSGYLGSGTTVDTVQRTYDKYLTQQATVSLTRSSESDALYSKLSQLDNMFGDPTAGLSPALQDFFAGVNQVAANPSLASARQSMVSSSEVLAGRFNSMATQIDEMYNTVNSQVLDEVQQINSLATQIGDVNSQISRAESAISQPPNDLLDMRDQLVAELNKHIRVSTVEDSTGSVNVFIGNGQQLVVGSNVNQLQGMTSSSNPEQIVVGLKVQNGGTQELAQNLIDGGTLGGLMKFRTDSLDAAANKLGMVAASLAMTFNAQQALGQDLKGANAQSAAGSGFQTDYFQISGPRVLASASGANTVKASFLPPTVGADGNFQSNLTGSDYVLRSDGTNLSLTRLSDGKVFPTSPATATTWAQLNTAIAGEGIKFQEDDGATPPNPMPLPTAGVDYLIEPTRGVASDLKLNPAIAADTSRIAAAAPVRTTLGSTNTGAMQVSQGQVSTGYSLANIANASFTYSTTTSAFSFTQGTAIVTAKYADGTELSIGTAPNPADTIPRLNGASELASVTFDGITVDLSGTPANNDRFTITANTNGVSDSRNAIKLASLQTQKTTEGGTATFQSSYAALVSQVGTDTSQAKANSDAQQALYQQNQAALASVSGVNLDEEAANLIKYQQAYQAAAKSLDIASKLFDTLLGISS